MNFMPHIRITPVIEIKKTVGHPQAKLFRGELMDSIALSISDEITLPKIESNG
tara:strand:+ start:504 stop:662 length:159 start_codon:yes stop_codon:yes gene_type:complete